MKIVLRHDLTVDGIVARLPDFRRIDPRTDDTTCRLAGDIPGRTAYIHLHADDPRTIHFDLDDANSTTLDWDPTAERGSVVSVGDLTLVLKWWLTRTGRHDEELPHNIPRRRAVGTHAHRSGQAM
jgi:hypothetical protein